MPKSQIALSIAGVVLVASAVTSQTGVALADSGGAADVRQSVRLADLPRFAGYQTESNDRSASVIITVPEASSCAESELTLARNFMGLRSEDSFVSGGVAAICNPGQEPGYRAGLDTFETGFVELPGPHPGDRILSVISDDGTNTTVTVTNLTTGDELSASTRSVPKNYEVGIQATLDIPQVNGKSMFAKNRVDGAKLKSAHPTRHTYTDDAGNKFKPTKIKRGTSFKVLTS